MKTLFGVVVMIAVGSNVAQAAPRKILVLPLDGNVDQATRARLNSIVLRMAKKLPGEVTVADTTFDETAAAVGCDPAKPPCADSVRATLAVDELVFGRASSAASTTLVVRRVRANGAPMTATTIVGFDEPETTTEAAIAPAFGMGATAPEPPERPEVRLIETPPRPIERTPGPAPTMPPARSSARPRGILMTVGGGAIVLVGLVLWGSVASEQDDIDAADPSTADDFEALRAKEDRAQRNAILGDVFFLAGAGLATWGVVTLYRDHEARREITLAPKMSATSAGLALEGHW